MKNILFIVVIGFFSFQGFGQDLNELGKGDPVTENRKLIEKLDAAVVLSDAQKTEINVVLEASQEELLAVREKYEPTLATMKTELKRVRDKYGKVNDNNKDKVKVEVQAIRLKYEPNLKAMQQELRAIKDVVKTEVSNTLRPEQLERLKQMNMDRRNKFKKRLKDKRDQRRPSKERPNR